MNPAAAVYPACGTGRDGTRMRPQGLKAYRPYFIGGGVVLALAALMVFGGLLGPSGKTICTATLNQAKDFGVISPSATLASDDAESTGVKNRKACTAMVGTDTYKLVTDVKKVDDTKKACRDFLKQEGCVALYSAARSDGLMTYQVREIPPGETDAALAASGLLGVPQQPAPAAEAPASEDASAVDNETVDTTGSVQGTPAPQPDAALQQETEQQQ